MKATKCSIVFNTKWGHIMSPISCESISQAIKLAKESKMAYRIFVDDKVIKKGWYN